MLIVNIVVCTSLYKKSSTTKHFTLKSKQSMQTEWTQPNKTNWSLLLLNNRVTVIHIRSSFYDSSHTKWYFICFSVSVQTTDKQNYKTQTKLRCCKSKCMKAE